MGDIVTRKCAKCKGTIEINKNNITDVLQFQGKYYHSQCFKELASQKAASNRGKPEQWKAALDSMCELETETKRMLAHSFAKDELNDWLLDNYDIQMVSSRFWQIIADLELGKYKGKKCKPIDIGVLCSCWKWGQHKLNEIGQYNKSHNKGPIDDNTRLMYDLAILVGKVPQFLAYKEKQKAAEIEITKAFVMHNDIDISKIGQGKQMAKRDVSDISDDLFIE